MTILTQRTGKDIWQNLWQFPLIETLSSEQEPDLSSFGQSLNMTVSNEITHILSHQRIKAKFYHIDLIPDALDVEWKKISLNELDDYPLPRLIDRYLQEQK